MKKETTVLVRKVDKKTWMKFRGLCLKEGISASEMVRRLITKYVKRK